MPGKWIMAVWLAGCTGGTDKSSGDSTGGALQWYLGCGDPVCSGYGGPFAGVPLCADEGISAGGACTDDGATCDPVDGCNALVVCAAEDPTTQPGGCPISLRAYKHAVHYLTTAERSSAADELLAVRLARWRYNGEPDAGRAHLGFLIDDQPGSAAVQADGRHVDLYGYTSLAVAAIQEQQARLAAQQAQIDALRAEVDALKRETCR